MPRKYAQLSFALNVEDVEAGEAVEVAGAVEVGEVVEGAEAIESAKVGESAEAVEPARPTLKTHHPHPPPLSIGQ